MADDDTSNDGFGRVTTKQYLLDTINERDRKYEQRFAATDKSIADANQSIKEALATALSSTSEALDKATSNTKEALATANDNIRLALGALDKRFDSITTDLSSFARKAEVEIVIGSMEKAVTKAEAAYEKRFEAVNAFREQLDRQQQTFARESEVNVKIAALYDKISILSEKQEFAGGAFWMASTSVFGVLTIVGPIVVYLLTRHAG